MAANDVLAKLAVQITADVAKFGPAINQAQNQLKGLNESVKSVNKVLGAFGVGFSAFAVVQGIKSVVGVASEFERTMSEVRAITGATGKDFDALRKSAIDLGASTKFSAKEVGELQIALGRLGFTTKEILEASEATLALAAATGEDLAKAADTAGSTVRGFGLDAKETQRVVDVMAKSFNTTALGLDNFTESMKYVAPIAAAANVSVEETTALLGVLADAGIRGSSAGTALRKIFGDLSKDGRPVQQRLAELGKTGITLSGALDEVGRTAQTALLVLTKNTDKANELTESFHNVAGEAEAMARVMQDNLAGDVEKLSSAWEGLILSFTKTDAVRGATQALTGFLGLLQGAGNDTDTLMKQLVRSIQGGADEARKGFIDLLKEVRYEAGKPIDLRVVNELADKYQLTSAQAAVLKDSLEDVNRQLGFQESAIKSFNTFAQENGYKDLKAAADAYIASLNEQIQVETNKQQKLKQLNVDTESDLFDKQAEAIQKNIDYRLRVIDIIKAQVSENGEAVKANDALATSEDKVAEKVKKGKEQRELAANSLEYYRDLQRKLNDEFNRTDVSDQPRLRVLSTEIAGVDELIKRYERLKTLGSFEVTIKPPDTKGLYDALKIDDDLIERFKAKMQEVSDAAKNTANNVKTSFEGVDLSGLLTSALAGIGDAFGEAISGTSSFGKALLGVLGGVLKQFGTMLVSVGVGILALKKAFQSLNGYVAIAAGIALIALGAWASSATKGLGSAGGGGGSSGGPQSTGNVERVQNQQTGKEITFNAKFRIEGRDLVAIAKNEDNRSGRLGG